MRWLTDYWTHLLFHNQKNDANTILVIALILILLTDFKEYIVLCVSSIIEILYVLLIFKVRRVCSTFLENGAGSEELQKTDLLTDVVILAPHTWQRHSQRQMHSYQKHKHTILNAKLFRQIFSQAKTHLSAHGSHTYTLIGIKTYAYTIACEHKIGFHPVLHGKIIL